MDCMETAVMRKAGLRGEMLMFSSAAAVAAGHCQHQLLYLQSPPSSYLPAEEAVCAPVDRTGGLLWEDFSVDDLLDLGGGKEQSGGEDNFLPAEEAEEEKEEEEEDDEEERKDSATGFNTCSSSVLSYQALPPSSDPIVPAGDVADLEWVSHFVDDSYSEFPSAIAPPPQTHHAPAPAPLEVAAKTEAPKPLSTGTSVTLKRTWQSCCFSTDSLVVPSKARSKRSRTGGRVWSLCLPSLLAESSSSSCSSGSSSASCSGSSSISSCLLYEKLGSGGWGDTHRFLDCITGGASSFSTHQPPPPQLLLMKKKKGRKPKALTFAAAAADGNGGGEQQTRRRCSHCGVDKTPQWRAGPMGAKTLCNACGVRYKSGRLLPEYRPAGSPTFLSHVHSNSHRKVLEMRRKKEVLEAAAASSAAPCSLLPPQLAVASQPYGVV